jgi:hypothetical protein
MGTTYIITLNNFTEKKQELIDFQNTVVAVNQTNQKYKPDELIRYDFEPYNFGMGNGNLWWNDYKNQYYYIKGIGGGSSVLLTLDDSNKWVKINNITTHPNTAPGPLFYHVQTKSGKIYGFSGAGLGEFDADMNIVNKGFIFAAGSIAYDSKRDFIITSSIQSGFSGNEKFIVQLDINRDAIVYNGFANCLYPIFLNQFTSTNQLALFLNYSSYDDMYYYAVDNTIKKTNPITGVAETILTKGIDIVGLMIEEGSNEAYYAYVNDDTSYEIIISKFNLDTPNQGTVVEYNIGNVHFFNFIYIGKTVVFSGIKTGESNSVRTLSKDLLYDLSENKYMYFPLNTVVNNSNTFPYTKDYFYVTKGNPQDKAVLRSNIIQKFKPLGNDEEEVQIPVTYFPSIGATGSTTVMQKISPVLPYPVVTDPTTDRLLFR